MADIILDRGTPNVFKLDESEQRMLDEIQISTEPKMKSVKLNKLKPILKTSNRQEDIDAFVNPLKQQPRSRPPPEPVFDGGEEEDEGMFGGEDDQEDFGGEPQEDKPAPGYFSLDDEKADLLNKLTRLEKKGFTVNKRLNAYSDINEMRSEYKRIMYSIEVDQSIKFSRRMLVACCTGLEFLNKRYNPFEIQLDGWSETVMEGLDDYDPVFEELYAKYKTKMQVAPEIKLIMMLGGSATMFHLTNSMFKAAVPNMNDILKQNPELVKNMVSAVQNARPRGDYEQQQQQNPGDRYEMGGPPTGGIDLSSLMGSIMMPPPMPMNSKAAVRPAPPQEEDDDMSDIISVSGESTGGEIKEVSVSGKGKRGYTKKSKKNEINL